MAWIHRVRKNLRPIPERRNPRYNGLDTQWEEISKICKYRARSRSSSACWAEKGSKKMGRTCSEHLHTSRCMICIRRNLHPAYTLATETSIRPVDRKKFGYRYILLTLSSRLLIGMHMTVYWKAMDEGAWEGPRRRNNILREQNGANTFVLDLRRIIPLFSLCGKPNVFLFSSCSQSLLSLRFSSGNYTCRVCGNFIIITMRSYNSKIEYLYDKIVFTFLIKILNSNFILCVEKLFLEKSSLYKLYTMTACVFTENIQGLQKYRNSFCIYLYLLMRSSIGVKNETEPIALNALSSRLWGERGFSWLPECFYLSRLSHPRARVSRFQF